MRRAIQNTNTDSLKISLYQKISKKYAPVSFDSAYHYGIKSLELAKRRSKPVEIIESYSRIGLAFDYQSKIDSTLFWYNKALKLAKETNNIPQLIKIYNHFGVAYYFDTKYDLSIKNYLQSLEYSKKINDSVGIARAYNNIGLIHEKQGNYKEAIKYDLMALAIKETFKSKELLIPPLTNLSNISIINNDFENGKKYMFRMLRICQEIQDTTLMAVSYSNLAKIYANNNEIAKSDYYLRKTLQLIENIDNKFEYSQLLFDLGGTYAKKNAFNEAEKSYLQSIAISEKLRRKELLEKSYKELSDLYRNNAKYTKALAYYDKYTKVKDSFFTVDKLKSVQEVEAKYKTQKKEQQIQQLKSNIEQQDRFWFWVSILSGLLALFFIFFIYFYKKRSSELAQKNQQINKALSEKEVLFKEIHHRVKNNLQIVSSILTLQGRYLKDPNAIEAINDSQNRIAAISLIHQKLYSKESITAVRVKDYIDDLVDNIIQALNIDADKINYVSHIENLLLDVGSVTPIGLILNELILNSLKHNTNRETLNLQIDLYKNDDTIVLKVSDDGKGLPDDFDYTKAESYGMKMIASLSKKLKADLQFINDNGLTVTILIKKFKEIEN